MSEKSPSLISKKDWINLVKFEPKVQEMLIECRNQTLADVLKIIDKEHILVIKNRDYTNKEMNAIIMHLMKVKEKIKNLTSNSQGNSEGMSNVLPSPDAHSKQGCGEIIRYTNSDRVKFVCGDKHARGIFLCSSCKNEVCKHYKLKEFCESCKSQKVKE